MTNGRVMITPEAMREQPAAYVDVLSENGFEISYPRDPMLPRGHGGEAAVIAELAGIDAVIAGSEPYTAGVLDALPSLRVIARAGVGYDRVDVAAATARNVALTITPTSNHEAVAELALALLFGVYKSLVVNDQAVRAGQWPRQLLRPIRGQTFGIVGLGRIGRSTAVRAQALGMQVLAAEKFPDPQFVADHNIELVEFDDLLGRSDIVSIHCPATPDTMGMFNADAFAKMKRGAVLLNTARGKLVVETDLVAALDSGQLSGAGLDVFEQEPPDPANPLLVRDDVVVSPHLAGTDDLSLVGMGVEAATAIVKLARNEWPDGAVVNRQLRDGWNWQR